MRYVQRSHPLIRGWALAWTLLLTGVAWAQQTEGPDDEALQAQIGEVLTEVEGYDGVEATVSAGVVQLRGTIVNADRREDLRETLEAMEGVTSVDTSALEVELALDKRLPTIADELKRRLRQGYQLVPLLVIAIGLVVLFAFLAKLVSNSQPLLAHFIRSPAIQNVVAQLGGLVTFVVGVVLALDVLGATNLVGGILGAAGVVGIVLGFAFKDLIENYIASLMLSVRQPFQPDDLVRIGEHEGVVARLTSRSTVLIDLDGNRIRLPNSMVFKSVIINYTSAPERRFGFDVGIGYDVDLQLAQRVAVETLLEVPGVLASPGPIARVCNLGDSTITLRIMGWVDQARANFQHVRSQAMIEIKRVFDAHDIDMPEPIYNLRMLAESEPHQPSVAPAPGPATEALAQSETEQSAFVRRQVNEERERPDGQNLIDDAAPTE